MSSLFAVFPSGVDDPARPSGGNVYDRRVLRGLAGHGWEVCELAIAGSWPRPEPADLVELDALLVGIPAGAVVLVDGLVACAAASVLPQYAGRLRLVVLLHMPVGPDDAERQVLTCAAAVVTTSDWSRERLRHWYGVRDVAVVVPGVDPPGVAPSRRAGGGTSFLSVAAVHPGKGLDVLLEALATLGDRAWTLHCVGSLDVDPDYASALELQVYARSWERRVTFTGPLTHRGVSAAYDAADLLVVPSRSESYGMVVAEALAHGIPVVASSVGGVPEALGPAPAGARPGLLVPPDDPAALAGALRGWLDDPLLRERLSVAAARRRPGLRTWAETVSELDTVLAQVAGVSAGVRR
jgi:glycosyltransferase involved in cell wall biosynthesis